ncbi:8915_t:CDS:2 [Paraglomus occultum]|uniref:8915_t:CDS:1 n=1 Tax=Paraglomus occultum TaxID=144539 RepID=A0A9N9GB50_9GLOM|nr:8915_t:CDS:2 [Paraglomus occultum]
MKFSAVVVALALFASANAVPLNTRQEAKPFTHQNGVDAQNLNDKFSKLTPNSPCTAGENACVNKGFAQCVGNTFQITQCAGGTQCFALPLVNKPGTSITCTTPSDAQTRISTALSAPAGGSSSSGNTPPPASTTSSSATPAATPNAAPKPGASTATGANCNTVRSCNARDAIKLANDFKKLNDNSPCTAGQNACVNGKFAQCVGGKFQSTACSGGTTCQVLPLVNSRGTSITCDTDADAKARIQDALNN